MTVFRSQKKNGPTVNQPAMVVQRLDNAIHWINCNPVDKCQLNSSVKISVGVASKIHYSKVDSLRSASKATMQNNTRHKHTRGSAKPLGLSHRSHTTTKETAGQRYPPFEQPSANVLYVVDITKTY